MFIVTEQDILDYIEGASSVDISKRYKVAPDTVIRALKRQGIQVRNRCEANTSEKFKLKQRARKNPRAIILSSDSIENYLTGKSSSEIAKELDISNSAVLGALRRQGVQIRTNSEAQVLKCKRNGSNMASAHKRLRELSATGEWAKRSSARRQGIPIEEWTEFKSEYWTRVAKTKEWKDWRQSVFERDSYTCKMCGDDKGGNLEPHHIYMKSKYPERVFDVSNGITLCRKCHRSISGYEDTMISQLENLI